MDVPATKAQLSYIRKLRKMAKNLIPLFRGTTSAEADAYIEKYEDFAHELAW